MQFTSGVGASMLSADLKDEVCVEIISSANQLFGKKLIVIPVFNHSFEACLL